MSDDLNTSEGTPAPPATPPTPPAIPPAAPAITSIEQIPQHLRTQIEMGHKKTLRSELDQTKQQLAAMQQLKDQVGGFMGLIGDRVKFEAGSDLEEVAGQITGTLDSMKTEAERLTLANEAKDKQLEAAKAAADKATQQLHTTLATNVLMGELMSPVEEGGPPRATSKKAAEIIAEKLVPFAKFGEDLSVSFEMETADENGHVAPRKLDAATAVGVFEADKEWYEFFTATRNGGAGGDASDTVPRAGDGNPDLNSFMGSEEGFAKFQELYDKNPEAFNAMYDKLD